MSRIPATPRFLFRAPTLAVGLIAVWWLAWGPAARAQTDNVFYSRYRDFSIPFNLDQPDSAAQHVILHVSRDLGKHYDQVA
jgi:hypothetical protein